MTCLSVLKKIICQSLSLEPCNCELVTWIVNMATYSEESREKLLKKGIINIVLLLQTEMKFNTKILKQVRKLNDTFTNLESNNVNSLFNQESLIQKNNVGKIPNSGRECLEAAGIPESVKQNELQDKVLNIFKKGGCDISSDNIKACHRVGGHNNVIIKFSKRKDYQQIFLVKLNMKDVDLPERTQIFVNQSSCLYYK